MQSVKNVFTLNFFTFYFPSKIIPFSVGENIFPSILMHKETLLERYPFEKTTKLHSRTTAANGESEYETK